MADMIPVRLITSRCKAGSTRNPSVANGGPYVPSLVSRTHPFIGRHFQPVQSSNKRLSSRAHSQSGPCLPERARESGWAQSERTIPESFTDSKARIRASCSSVSIAFLLTSRMAAII
jgi:hypothetical protein